MDKSILDIVSSLTEGQSLDLDATQLTELHHRRMEQAKREMMERQEREMEELFVQQVGGEFCFHYLIEKKKKHIKLIGKGTCEASFRQ